MPALSRFIKYEITAGGYGTEIEKKRIIVLRSCLVLLSCLAGCGRNRTHYYSSFTAEGENDRYEITRKARITEAAPIVCIDSLEDTLVKLKGRLKSISGDVQKEILDTILAGDTKITMSISVDVTNSDRRMEFRGFDLFYKTDSGDEISVLEHETNEMALGDYFWKDHFNKEVRLPVGTNI